MALHQRMSDFRSENVSLQTKWLILFYCTNLANKALEEKLEAEVTQVDQKVVLELDQLVSDQQATLQVRIISLVFLFSPAVYSFSGPRSLISLSWRFHVYRSNVDMLCLFWIFHRGLVFPCFPSQTTLMTFDFKCTFWISYSDWTTLLAS